MGDGDSGWYADLRETRFSRWNHRGGPSAPARWLIRHYLPCTIVLALAGLLYAVLRAGPTALPLVFLSLVFVPQMRREKRWLAEWERLNG